MYWCSCCRICEAPTPELPFCLVAECLLSYIRLFGGRRQYTGLTERERGHLFSTQVENFRNALGIFGRMTGAVALVPARARHSQLLDWTKQWALPAMACVSVRGFAPPFWSQCRDQLHELSLFVVACQLEDSRRSIYRALEALDARPPGQSND
eukprot:233960-Amphidinium_carterae.1